MADEHNADAPKDTGMPMTGADPTAPEHTQKADTSQARASLDHPDTLIVKDVDRPAGSSGDTKTSAANDDSLYDRLAAKDREPTASGGDGPVP